MTLRRRSISEPDSPSTATRSGALRARRAKARTYRTALLATAFVAVGGLAVSDIVATPQDATAATMVAGDGLASDGFGRTSATGFGSADTGGAYTSTSTVGLSVGNGAATIQLDQGQARNAVLSSFSAGDVESTISVVVPNLPVEGNGVYVGLQARSDGKSFYRPTVRISPAGTATLSIVRLNGSASTQTTLASETVVATGVKAGSTLNMSSRVYGTSSVQVEARAWLKGTSTPGWQRTATDTSAKRVASGGVGIWAYLSGLTKATSVRLDDLSVKRLVAQTSPTTPPTTPPPTTPAPTPTTPTEPPPTEPQPSTGDRGSAPVGSTSYSVPANAIFVSASASNGGSGSKAAPYRTVADAIAKAPSGSTLVLRGGTYHESVEIPAGKKLTIQSYPKEAVWFDGAQVVSSWAKSGSTWSVGNWTTNFDSSPTFTKGQPDGKVDAVRFVDPNYPMAAHPDQVWVNGKKLTQVGSAAAVKDGTFFVDNGAKRLVIGSDPSGKTVTASTLQKAIKVTGIGSTVRGLGVRNYATSVWQMGTVTPQVAGVTLENLVVTGNATMGVYGWGKGITLRNITSTGNGMFGGGATSADDLTVTNSVFDGNNSERFNRMPGSGGFKITRSRNLTITDNDFTNNVTTGLWLDESSYNAVISGNRSVGNGATGIILEISDTMKVANNVISDNGRYGLWIGNTGNVQVWNNTIADNDMAPLQFQMDKRRQTNLSFAGHDKRQTLPDMTVPWIISNVTVSNNVISGANGGCLLCVDDHTQQMSADAMGISLNGNLYHRVSMYSPKSAVRWGQGQDPAKTFADIAAFSAATGKDKKSALSEGANIFAAGYTLNTRGITDAAKVTLQGVPSAIASLVGAVTGKAPERVGATITG